MEEFTFWTRWGLGLNDNQFANAFTALGLIAAPAEKAPEPRAVRLDAAGKSYGKKLSENEITAVLCSLVVGARERDSIIRWQFPRRDGRVQIRKRAALLSKLDPEMIASSWEKVSASVHPNLRFQVAGYPSDEQVMPWFRLLFESAPSGKSAYIEFGTEETPLQVKWPLRFGFLPGDQGEMIVMEAVRLWPSNNLAMSASIDRDNTHCDVLVFGGESSRLLTMLLDLPGIPKSSLVVLRGRPEEYRSSLSRRLLALASESSACGFIFLHPDTPNDAVAYALNGFVENLSHNQPLDLALSEAFTVRKQTDPAIFLSRSLASFRIEKMLEKIKNRLTNLPIAAQPKIMPEMLERMGLSGDAEIDYLIDPKRVAMKLEESRDAIRFDAENTGALSIAKMTKAIEHAENSEASASQSRRFLQGQILIKKKRKYFIEGRAFLKGVPTLIRVKIGPPEEGWERMETPVPEEKLPRDRDEWRLTVVLTELKHLNEPLRGSIKLPRYGPSTICEFRVQLGDHSIFEGRITVLHRGRVLQTGVIRGSVVTNEREINPTEKISFFEEITQVRSHLNDLEGRRQFDLAFVMNHSIDKRPCINAIATKHAWLADISACQAIVRNINSELTKVADREKDYRSGLDSDESVKVLVKLAQIGRQLYGKIVADQIKNPGNQESFANLEYIQIVSTKTDALMPLEFIYTAVAPNDDAKLCPSMAATVKEKSKDTRKSKVRELIDSTCQKVDKGRMNCRYRTTEYVCPMGFWGISKVIERHLATPCLAQPGIDFFLQSEPTSYRGELQLLGTAIVAASEKVKPKMLSPVLSACAERLGCPPKEAKDWVQWVNLVNTYKPHILLALPHTYGNGENATLEIKGKLLSSGQITSDHVHATDDSTFPLVALLGCDTAGTALDYGEHISWFRREGAALVISTIAKVFGGHAVSVAEQLIRGLTQEQGQQERVGEIIREIKRQVLYEGSLMALCVVAFGDADWKLKGKEN